MYKLAAANAKRGRHKRVSCGYLFIYIFLTIINHRVNSNSAKLICPGGRAENKNGSEIICDKKKVHHAQILLRR